MKIFVLFYLIVFILNLSSTTVSAKDFRYGYSPRQHVNTKLYPFNPPASHFRQAGFVQQFDSFNNTFINPGPIILPGGPRRVLFISLGLLLNGSFGSLHGIEQGAPFASISYPRAYIYGIIIPQGGGWVGNIYPTLRNIYFRGHFYPVYTISPGMARKINQTSR